jgi:hypothetical protein
MAKADLRGLPELTMREAGAATKKMGRARWYIKIKALIKATGRMTSAMVKAL